MIGKTTFRDNLGRLWKVELDAAGLERARWTGVDLRGAGMNAYLPANPVVALNVLYYAVKPQADERGVTADDFVKTCGNGQKAIACLIEALKEMPS